MITKRQRVVYASGPKRPIDKKIVSIQASVGSGAQTSATVFSATEAVTYTGGHVSWCFVGAGAGVGAWALIYVREGNVANTVDINNSSTFYTPEQDILALGHFGSSATDFDVVFNNLKIKTKRKMKAGDTIIFRTTGSAAAVGTLAAAVT